MTGINAGHLIRVTLVIILYYFLLVGTFRGLNTPFVLGKISMFIIANTTANEIITSIIDSGLCQFWHTASGEKV